MKSKRIIYHICLLCIGVTLIVLAVLGKVDEFWNGAGSGLMIVSAIQLLRQYRLNKNEAYREKFETAISDERNHFIRSKAWSWAGYLFIIITALSVIGFKLAGNDLLSQAAAGAVGLMLILYWASYWALQKKY